MVLLSKDLWVMGPRLCCVVAALISIEHSYCFPSVLSSYGLNDNRALLSETNIYIPMLLLLFFSFYMHLTCTDHLQR